MKRIRVVEVVEIDQIKELAVYDLIDDKVVVHYKDDDFKNIMKKGVLNHSLKKWLKPSAGKKFMETLLTFFSGSRVRAELVV